MSKYSEKLRDPRWQRKRLEIMQRDNFACTLCSDSKSTLNVHHWEYKGEPWDVENDNLSTVCVSCHELIELRKKGGLPTRAGRMYRFLEAGEIIQEGDEWWACGKGWLRFGNGIGQPYRKYDWGDFSDHWKLPSARRMISKDLCNQ
jgi:hypothetical protein